MLNTFLTGQRPLSFLSVCLFQCISASGSSPVLAAQDGIRNNPSPCPWKHGVMGVQKVILGFHVISQHYRKEFIPPASPCLSACHIRLACALSCLGKTDASLSTGAYSVETRHRRSATAMGYEQKTKECTQLEHLNSLVRIFPGGHMGGRLGKLYGNEVGNYTGRRMEMGAGFQEPPPCTAPLKASLLYFVWTMRPIIPASNLGDFLLCDFQIKHCNYIMIRHFSLLCRHSIGQTCFLFGDHRLDKGTGDILVVLELFVLITWLESTLKTDVYPLLPPSCPPALLSKDAKALVRNL